MLSLKLWPAFVSLPTTSCMQSESVTTSVSDETRSVYTRAASWSRKLLDQNASFLEVSTWGLESSVCSKFGAQMSKHSVWHKKH